MKEQNEKMHLLTKVTCYLIKKSEDPFVLNSYFAKEPN